MQTLQALDLTKIRGADDLWRSRRATTRPAVNHVKLPDDGFASPMGFWFAPAESWGKTVVTPLRVEVCNTDEQDGEAPGGKDRLFSPDWLYSSRRAQLGLKSKRTQSVGSIPRLIIDIDPCAARIRVAPEAWASISNIVLLVVAQYWRFVAITHLLDDIADWVRGDLHRHRFINLIHRRRSRELRAHRRVLQALILDLPDFELLLTNPTGYLSPGRPIRLYRALVAQLGLKAERRALDERVEVVEAVLDSLADSLNHLQALAFQIALELAIVTLLLLDVGFYFWDTLSR
jgi:PAS domain-containing protein